MLGACEVPTRQNPNGRTGTIAGVSAHFRAKEKLCSACAKIHYQRIDEYQKTNKEKINAKNRRYQQTELGRKTGREKRRRHRARKLGGNIIPASPVCVCCRTHDELEVDHIVPLSRGGSDEPVNHQWLCRACNASKGASDTCGIHDRFLGVHKTRRIRANQH